MDVKYFIMWDYEGNTFMRDGNITVPGPQSFTSIFHLIMDKCDEEGISPYEVSIGH